MAQQRVYATPDGRLLLVSGDPQPELMLRYLSHLNEGHSHIVTPSDLGFLSGMVEEASLRKLTAVGRALTKWEQFSKRNHRVTTSNATIVALRQRLASIHEWRRAAIESELVGQPWQLCEAQSAILETNLSCLALPSQTDPHIGWFARLVMWIAGESALARFCTAVSHLPDISPEAKAKPQLRATVAKLQVWAKRARTEHCRQIRWEVKQWIKQLPPALVTRAGLSSKFCPQTMIQRLEEQTRRCIVALNECQDGGRFSLLAAIATLAACDRSAAPIPGSLVKRWAMESDRVVPLQAVRNLLSESNSKGYDQLLRALEVFPASNNYDYHFLRTHLGRGASFDDIRWVLDKNLQDCLEEELPRLAWARRLDERLAAAGLCLDSSKSWRLFSAVDTAANRSTLDDFADWVASLPAAARTPRLCQLLVAALSGPFLRAMEGLGMHAEIREWNQAVTQQPRASSCSEVEAWVSQVRRVESFAESANTRTARADQLLARERKRGRERIYLERLINQGKATPLQAARSRHLQMESRRPAGASERKVLRSLQKSYVLASIDALRYRIRKGAQPALGSELAVRLQGKHLGRVLEFAEWVKKRSPVARHCFEGIMRAHQHFGEDYKQHLSCNSDWIAQMRDEPIAIGDWLRPSEWVGEVAGAELTISASLDPVETFLMGQYFGTCLSLGDCYEESLLPNAAEANKHVLYARDQAGKVVARQLIAIDKRASLLGYCCYVRDSADDFLRDCMLAAMTSYCVNLAKRCRLTLANQGVPKTLGKIEWYDDGPVAWQLTAEQRDALEGRTPIDADQGRCVEAVC